MACAFLSVKSIAAHIPPMYAAAFSGGMYALICLLKIIPTSTSWCISSWGAMRALRVGSMDVGGFKKSMGEAGILLFNSLAWSG